MKKLFAFALGTTALMGVSMMGPAQAADFEPVTVYPFAATAFVGGGGAWLDGSSNCFIPGGNCDKDIGTIVGGGDIVLPLNGFWNIQLGGAFHIDHSNPFGRFTDSLTQFQGSAIGFWRDPGTGVFGIEAGLFSPRSNSRERFNFNSVKIGGVAEYFFSDMITIGGFGGVLIPMEPSPGKGGKEIDLGFYAGGHGTYYASDNLAFAGFVRFAELNVDFNSPKRSDRSLNVGGQVRYLTSIPGLELFASGSYHECERGADFGNGGSITASQTGARIMAGVNVRLGGQSDSLVGIDRSNAIDTRAWACDLGQVKIAAPQPQPRPESVLP